MSRSFQVLWDWPALVTFYRLPLHTATMIDHAVVRFAERGEGDLEWVAPHYRLRAGLYDVALNIDVERSVVTVVWFHRAR